MSLDCVSTDSFSVVGRRRLDGAEREGLAWVWRVGELVKEEEDSPLVLENRER
jgi:hypothetical protein